jgi:hypothetical protein
MNAINQPQSIVRKKAGFTVPREFFRTALRECPSATGVAIRDVEDGVTTLQLDRFDTTATVDSLMDMQETIKPYEAAFWFANLPGAHKDSLQPYTLEVREDESSEPITVLTFFVEGDIPKYSIEGSERTDEANFVADVVMPLLEEYFTDAEGDIGKFTAKLHKPSFEKTLMAYTGHRAIFLFLPLEGDPIMFGDSKGLGADYDWGNVSQHLDWDKKNKETPITKAADAVVASVKKAKYSLMGKKPDATITTDTKGIHTVAPKLDVAMAKAGDIALPTATAGTRTRVEVVVPKKLDGDARNIWIRLFNAGELPKDHQKKDLKIWVYADQVPFATRDGIVTKAHVRGIEKEMQGLKLQPQDMKSSVPPTVAPTSGLQIAKDRAAAEARSPADFIPDMDDKDMTDQTAILSGFVGRDKVPSWMEIQKLEAPWPTYSQKMGIPFADLLRYTVGDISAICKGHKPSVMLILEFRRNMLQMLSADRLKDLIGTATPAEKEVVASSSKTTAKHVEAKEILKPPRYSLFGKKAG